MEKSDLKAGGAARLHYKQDYWRPYNAGVRTQRKLEVPKIEVSA